MPKSNKRRSVPKGDNIPLEKADKSDLSTKAERQQSLPNLREIDKKRIRKSHKSKQCTGVVDNELENDNLNQPGPSMCSAMQSRQRPQTETDEQRVVPLEHDREQKHRKRQRETDEQRHNRLERDRDRKRRSRENETDEQHLDRLKDQRSRSRRTTLHERVILSPKNDHVFKMNNDILKRLPGTLKIYKSIDEAECPIDDHITNYPMEFLNSLTPNGLPPHLLKLKIGAIVMLLRNLNIGDGLCNGTRFRVQDMKENLLLCKILTGSKKNRIIFLPRINLIPAEPFLPVVIKRRQFPIRVSFAMTINKSEGQTFSKVGLYLPTPVFSHGQLYVAFSRVRNPQSIIVLIETGGSKTKNIVYKEILD